MNVKRTEGVLSLATSSMTCDPDPAVNRGRMAEMVRQTMAEHPDLRLFFFGETILGWFYRNDETLAYHQRIAETIPGPSTTAMAELACELDLYICFGLTERHNGRLHNSQVLIDPAGTIVAVHRKIQIRNPVFSAGTRHVTTAEVDGAKVALAICADVRNLQLIRGIRKAGPDIVLASLADYATGLMLPRIMGTLFDAWTVVANRYGKEPPLMWHGLITVTDPWARLRAHGMGRQRVIVHRIPLRSRNRSGLRVLRRAGVGLKLVGLAVFAGVLMVVRSLRKLIHPSRPSKAA